MSAQLQPLDLFALLGIAVGFFWFGVLIRLIAEEILKRVSKTKQL